MYLMTCRDYVAWDVASKKHVPRERIIYLNLQAVCLAVTSVLLKNCSEWNAWLLTGAHC
jgi:hypothetical protein